MSDEQLQEKERTCPSCRTPISVLASKCKFCGEVVGKPKEETRSLSINDLGGESVHHRALSSSVMDALESFRIEDEQSTDDGAGFGGLDNLDDLQSSGIDSYDRPSSMSPSAAGTPSAGNRMALVAKIAVALVVIAILAIKVPGLLKSTFEKDSAEARNEIYVNRAPGILESNGDTIEALSAAIEAKKEDPSPENSKIADDVLDKVTGEIQALLDSASWDMDKLKEASRIATRAVELYPTSKSTEIKAEVDQENIDYRMFVASIDPGTKSVNFQLNTPGSPKVTVKRGELVANRFKLVSISGSLSVKIEDTKRNNRELECKIAGSPR